MAEDIKQDNSATQNKVTEANRNDSSVVTPSPIKKPTVVPKTVTPINVTPTADKAKEVKQTVKDPKGMFDYSNCKTYKVQDGDTLFSIAQKFVVAMQQLRYFNHLNRKAPKIRVGQVLVIPNKPISVPYGE